MVGERSRSALGVAAAAIMAACLSLALSADASDSLEHVVKRSDESSLTYYLALPSSNHFSLLILVQGGECRSSRPIFDVYRSTMVAAGIAALVVEPQGISQHRFWTYLGFCPREFKAHNTSADRVLDYLQVLQAFRAGLPGWDRRIVWAGIRDGGVVALEAAPMVAETRAIALLGTGAGFPKMEELAISKKKTMESRGASELQISRTIDKMGEAFRAIRDRPESTARWNGKTYKWWASLFNVDTLQTVEHADGPVYLAHGTSDQLIPVESADVVAERYKTLGKTNLTYSRYVDFDQDWRDKAGKSHQREVISDFLNWIQTKALTAP